MPLPGDIAARAHLLVLVSGGSAAANAATSSSMGSCALPISGLTCEDHEVGGIVTVVGDARGSTVAVMDRTSSADPLTHFWGPDRPSSGGRVPGRFARPDHEVFRDCGPIARCARTGAQTTIVSLTQAAAGQIRDSATATRRTLGAVRAEEPARAGSALGVDRTECLQELPGTERFVVAFPNRG